MRHADEAGDAVRLGSDQLEAALGRAQEAGPQEEIFGRIARHRELGERAKSASARARFLEAGEDALAVPVDVPDNGVYLGERKPHSITQEDSD